MTITVELQGLILTSTRDESIGLIMQVQVTVTPAGASSQTASARQKRYEYVGPAGQLSLWLDERSDYLDTSLSSAIQVLAAQIVAELAPR